MMNNIVEKVLTHHLTAFGNNDLDEIMKDYAETSVIITPNGSINGLVAIRLFFEEFFTIIPTGSAFSMKQKTIIDHIAYIAWRSDSIKAKIPMGTDTFVFENDKIKYHTVANYKLS